MASTVDSPWQHVQALQTELRQKLEAERDPASVDTTELLTRYRVACEELVALDIQFADTKQIEARLWDVHSKINALYRERLRKFQSTDAKGKVVERRKLMTSYLNFIKSSQRFYRAYIQKLASHHGGISELEYVAHQFKVEKELVQDQTEAASAIRRLVLLSCYHTLIRLGDLSRYRETELARKARDWGPAIGYYDLANAILPSSGVAHNQLAVVASVEANHLRATYHFYRSLVVDEPHPLGRKNLAAEFKKIIEAWNSGQLIPKGVARGGDSTKILSSWFVLLHARSYDGQLSSGQELEREVLNQLGLELRKGMSDRALSRLVLTNVAAEFFARERVTSEPAAERRRKAFYFMLGFNVKTFVTLLEALHGELERVTGGRAKLGACSDEKGMSLALTALVRRLLPAVRVYTSWLAASACLLVPELGDAALTSELKSLWTAYAKALTALVSAFPVQDLPSVGYLLEEDADTVGFKPFENKIARRWIHGDGGRRKPRRHDPAVDVLGPDTEMLARVRDILTDALQIVVVDKAIPVRLLDDGVFSYSDPDPPRNGLISTNGRRAETPDGEPERDQVMQEPETDDEDHDDDDDDDDDDDGDDDDGGDGDVSPITTHDLEPVQHDFPAGEAATCQGIDVSEAAPLSESAAMNRMVDSIVGPDLIADEPGEGGDVQMPVAPRASVGSATADTTYGALGTLTAAELVKAVQNYSQNRRGSNNSPPGATATTLGWKTPATQSSTVMLPSIMKTPFAPQASDMAFSHSSASSPRTRPGTSMSNVNGITGASSFSPGTGHGFGAAQTSGSADASTWYMTGGVAAAAQGRENRPTYPNKTAPTTALPPAPPPPPATAFSAIGHTRQTSQPQNAWLRSPRASLAFDSSSSTAYGNDSTREVLMGLDPVWGAWTGASGAVRAAAANEVRNSNGGSSRAIRYSSRSGQGSAG